MPRDNAGNYNLPLAPVVGGETIKADAWANPTLEDIRLALESSLSRDGQGGMRAPLPFGDGSVTAPSVTFTSETSSGIYRAGPQDIRLSVAGTDVMQYLADRALTRNPETSQLEQVATMTMLPAQGTIDGQTLRWEASSSSYEPASDFVIADDGNVGIGTDSPQAALDVRGDISLTGDIVPAVDQDKWLGQSDKTWEIVYSRRVLSGDAPTLMLGTASSQISIDTSGNFYPNVDGTQLLGTGVKRWSRLNAVDVRAVDIEVTGSITATSFVEDGTALEDKYTPAIVGLTNGKIEVVASLPGSPDPNTVYIVTG